MFVGKSLIYSVFVSLRMIPILAVTLYSAFLLFYPLYEQPWLVLVIGGLVYIPVLVFLYLNAVRCGLTAMGATTPPVAKRYLPATVRLTRFNLLLTNVIVGVVGAGLTFILLSQLMPDVWQEIRAGLFGAENLDLEQFSYALGDIPLASTLFFSFALCLAFAVTGTTAGATANWVGHGAPNHDMIWGATRQWAPLLTLALVTIFLPTLFLVLALGGPMIGLWKIAAMSPVLLVALFLYYLWAICANCAGAALAYVHTVAENEVLHDREHNEMSGPEFEDTELRAIRHQRTERARIEPVHEPAE